MPQTSSMPFYLDWSFWTVIVAAIDILLSQLPPIHLLLKRAKLDLEIYSRIFITHKIGNPNLQLHLIINNTGGRAIKVKSITANLKREGKEIATLPAQNYYQNPSDEKTVLFTSFSIKPKEEWAHLINFLNYFSREDEKKYKEAESKLKENIFEKKELPKNKEKLVEADNKNVIPFLDFFKEKFLWKAGEYEIKVILETIPNRASVERNFRFTLFESDSDELSKYKDDYKFGDGIFYFSHKHSGIIIQLSEVKSKFS